MFGSLTNVYYLTVLLCGDLILQYYHLYLIFYINLLLFRTMSDNVQLYLSGIADFIAFKY
jgi:hypothetical protein